MKKFIIALSIFMLSLTRLPAQKMEVKRIDNPGSQILSGIVIPEGKRIYMSSGIVSTPLQDDEAAKRQRKYGNTYEQAISIMNKIEGLLKNEGLNLKDVVYLRIYVTPDPEKENKPDYEAWFKAYEKYFNNPDNPLKVARSTIGVHSLARSELLIEIEAIAIFQN
jgi:enamine deaminase RidA (YjgF/YER057c/UK114 family)